MKYSKDELLKWDVIKVDTNSKYCYLVGDATVNTTNDEYYEDGHGIKDIDFSNLVVNDNDLITITKYANKKGKYNLLISNLNTNTKGYAYTIGNCYDDNRYYITHYIAELIRQMKVKNVTVKFYLWYTEQLVEDYIDMISRYIDIDD